MLHRPLTQDVCLLGLGKKIPRSVGASSHPVTGRSLALTQLENLPPPSGKRLRGALWLSSAAQSSWPADMTRRMFKVARPDARTAPSAPLLHLYDGRLPSPEGHLYEFARLCSNGMEQPRKVTSTPLQHRHPMDPIDESRLLNDFG
jgi:hypothetical protein